MGVYTRGNRYWISYTAHGKRYREKTELIDNGTKTNRKLAEAIYSKKNVQIAEGKFLDKKIEPTSVTLEEYSNTYIEDYAKRKNPLTWDDKQRSLRLICKSLGNKYLHHIVTKDIENYVFERLKSKKTFKDGRVWHINPKSINIEIGYLRHLFNCAIADNKATSNPVKGADVWAIKDESLLWRERILTEQESKIFFSFCSEKLQDIILLFLNTGFRKQELLNLKWPDVNFDTNLIHITKRKANVPLHMPMSNFVRQILLKRKARHGEQVFVFQSSRKVKPFDFRKGFETARKLAGLKDLRVHDLRHTFATDVLKKTKDINLVRELLGHKDLTMTIRYIKYLTSDKIAALDQVSDKYLVTNLSQPNKPKSNKDSEFNTTQLSI